MRSLQPQHVGHLPLAVPDFQPVDGQPHSHLLTDQPARDRVGVPSHVDQAAGIDPDGFALGRLDAPFRKPPPSLRPAGRSGQHS